MKKFIALIIIFFSYISVAFCAPNLTNSTFQVNHIKNGEKSKSGLNWLVYFKSDGKAYYQVTKPTRNHTYYRTGKWEITEKGEFCTIRYVRNDNDRKITQCGTLVSNGPNNYNRYNDKGDLISTFTYVGTGKLFGKKK